MQPIGNLNQTNLRRLALAAAAVCALIVGFVVYQSMQFHIVNTTPSIDNFPASSPVLFIDFSKPLAKTTLMTVWNPGVSSSYAISGQRLTVNIQSVLDTNKQYTVTIKGIKAQTNESLGDITYTFTTKDIAYNDLPPEIQQMIFRRQDQSQTPSRNTITFGGTEELIRQGISTYQIEALKQAVFLFGQSTKTNITTAVIDTNSVTIPPYNNNAPDYFTMLLDISINNTRYHAALQYSNMTAMELKLSQGSAQVYDSGSIDGSAL